MMQIAQIVPYLPPSISGVGDYAMLLALELRRSYDIYTNFIVSDPEWKGPSELNGFSVQKVTTHSAISLADLLNQENENNRPVLLQYVGYGYDKRGCPKWLLQGIKLWKGQTVNRKLLVMFHELYASGPPWRTSFWLSHYQQHMAIHLAQLADGCITNMQSYRRWLEKQVKKHAGKIMTIPVFSNIGEMKTPRSLELRLAHLVIFGGAQWVRILIGRYRKEILRCCSALNLQKIITVGSPLGTMPTNLPVSVAELGFLAADSGVVLYL